MFKTVGSIHNFGVFNHFTGGSLPAFAPFNLIYGWNYSGKTTLSRVFRCLETGALHPDYQHARFSIIDDNNVHYDHQFAAACNVRVFNEDFRKQHLLWDEADGFSPILLLGAENIALREYLATKESEHREAEERGLRAATEKAQLEDTISKAETECATQIVKDLPVGRFNKTNLRPIIEAWNGTLPEELSANDVKTARSKVTAEQKEELPNLAINIDAARADRLWQEGAALLSEQLGSSGLIDRLVANRDVADWVEQGHHLHKGRDHCEFCESVLRPERIQAINAHFSDAFGDLKLRLSTAIADATAMKLQFSGTAYVKAAFYADLHVEHGEAAQQLADARDVWNLSLDRMIEALERKQANPFDVISPPDMHPDATTISAAIARFKILIDACNGRTREFTTEREASIEILKGHLTADKMRSIDRFAKEGRIRALKESEQNAALEMTALDLEIKRLQAELSNATRGADAINDTLHRFFGKADIQVEVTGDDRFRLMRGVASARNLSEGERTAIAFCYFITKLLERGNDLSQTIVYIDDPISSLDAHHLLHVCAFIRNTFYKRNHTAPKHECLVKQLFISTHSHEFFHLMLDWVRSMNAPMWQSFLIERIDADGLISSRLIQCPESIRKYRSEYLYLFHQLAAFVEHPQNDHQIIFNLGNMARRFVEGYVAFKFMEHTNVDSSIDNLIVDPVNAERARKFMHFHSHTLSRNGGMLLPDMSEAQSIVNCILDAVRTHDPIHFNALEGTR